jgi:hypothetical protein
MFLNRPITQIENKQTAKPNHSIEQVDLTDIHRTLYSTAGDYFSSAHRTFSG